MSGDPIVTKISMKKEDSKFDEQLDGDNQSNPLVSFVNKEIMNNNHTSGHRLKKDMSQSIGLFRKYLLAKTQQHIGKTNEEESEAIKKRSPRDLVPSKVSSNLLRRPSFLEQELLPKFRSNAELPKLSNNKSLKSQLTIFYSGFINVYDNIPVDKAQDIMVLAGESSLLNPNKATPTPTPTKPLQCSNLPSVSKLQADLPIARKHSLQRFLQKRRDRIVNKSPYASPITNQEFPSSLECLLPVSAHMA